MPMDPSKLLAFLTVVLYLLAMVSFFSGFAKSRFGRPRTVRAEVVGKQTVERFSKYAANGKSVRYAVTFLAEGKKRSFYVSEFSYRGYRKGEKGKLTYQGDRLIDFH